MSELKRSYKSIVEYLISDLTTRTYNFPFKYLRKKFIKVSVKSRDTILATLEYGVDYTVENQTITILNPSKLTVSALLVIQRETPTEALITWNDGSMLLSSDMTLEQVQLLHLQEEQRDYLEANSISVVETEKGSFFNANNLSISNVADPTDAQDVVTKQYMESVQDGFVQRNKEIESHVQSMQEDVTNKQKQASASATLAKAWAISTETPDNATDTESTTGKTQSARTWALRAEELAENIGNPVSNVTESNSLVTVTKSDGAKNTFYAGLNVLARNKTYSVGDIAYSPNLPSWAYLECTTAGTTGATEPDFSTVVTKKTITILSKFTVSDGTVTWRLRDTRCKYEVGDIIPKVGSIKDYEYLILADGGAFDKAYTELAKVFTEGKVPNLQDGRFLEGGITAKQVKGAGLPNICGSLAAHGAVALKLPTGAFYTEGNTAGEPANDNTHPEPNLFGFNASRYNSIYGSSNTVQPKSYTVKYYICYGG